MQKKTRDFDKALNQALFALLFKIALNYIKMSIDFNKMIFS